MESLPVVGSTLCLAFSDEVFHEQRMKNSGLFRRFLVDSCREHPELFPPKTGEGFTLNSFTTPSKKPNGLRMRRIELRDGRVHQIRPSFAMPCLIAKT